MFSIDDTVMGLLLTIQDEPNNDTPRLVLSDYLQESDNENDRMYGLFIRAQVLGDVDAEPLYRFVRSKYETSLLKAHFGGRPEDGRNTGPGVYFERGFVWAVRMASAGWKMYGKLVGKYHPSVTIVNDLESPHAPIFFSGVDPESMPNERRYPNWRRRDQVYSYELHNGYVAAEIFDLMKCQIVSSDKSIKPYPGVGEAYQALFDAYREYSGGFFVTSPNMSVIV